MRSPVADQGAIDRIDSIAGRVRVDARLPVRGFADLCGYLFSEISDFIPSLGDRSGFVGMDCRIA